jgi:hypothetical protein
MSEEQSSSGTTCRPTTDRGTTAKFAAHRDRQQAAKRDVYARWLAWQEEPSQYQSLEAFAIGMLDRHDCLSAISTILNWCKAWRHGKDLPKA